MAFRKTNYTRHGLLAATTLVVAACGGGSDDDYTPPPPPVNSAPAIAGIADVTSNQDTTVGPIQFGISDRESDASLLTVVAAADGTSVVPADGVTLSGTGGVRSITLVPQEAATGAVNVTLTVTDPQGAATTRSFQVMVNARTASMRDWALATFAKTQADEVTSINGFTFIQDADDPAIFQPMIGVGEE